MEIVCALVILVTLVVTPISAVICLIQKIRKKPIKKWGFIALASLVLFIVAAILMPTCEHEWVEATCEAPKTCTLCEATEGEPLGHLWAEATCTEAQVCSVCDATEGEALGHDWVEATCALAKHCTRCELTEGEALEHTWNDPTCLLPKTCAACSATEGEALGHDYSEMEIVKKATCAETGYAEGVCARCQETTEQEIPLKEHKMGKWTTTLKAACEEDGSKERKCKNCDYVETEAIPMTGHGDTKWVVTVEAEEGQPGERDSVCTVCEKTLATESYELSAKQIKENYIKSCKKYTYKEIARNPSEYEGKRAKFTGEVIQVQKSSFLGITAYTLRVDVTKGSYGIYTDTVYVTYYASEDEAHILEDDIITMYGELKGEKTYETIFGASVTIPEFEAKYINIK